MQRFALCRAGAPALIAASLILLAGCGSSTDTNGSAGSGGTGGAAAAGGAGGAGGEAGMAGSGGGSAGTGGSGGFPPITLLGPTSIDALDAALEAGDIDDVDALRFKVFAIFGDARLPEEFFSEEPIEDGTQVLIELVERFDSLPQDVQDELDPFLRPPADPLSWYQLRETANVPAEKSGFGQKQTFQFQALSAVDNKVLIAWPAANPTYASEAQDIKNLLEGTGGVWTKLTALLGREPRSDDGIIESYNGGDGRFDIYIIGDSNVVRDDDMDGTPDFANCFGWTAPYRAGGSGNARASYIVMNRDRIAANAAGWGTKFKSNLAHEFFHALQFAFDVTESRTSYMWMMESTATWVEHFMFENDNLEHEDAPGYFEYPHFTLSNRFSNHEYGAYLYWFFLTERPGGSSNIIGNLWALTESQSAEDAANAATPGGFVDAFGDFAAANWNRQPFNSNSPYDVYDNDNLREAAGPGVATNAVKVTEEMPMANPEDDVEVSFEGGGVARLSAQYVHYDLSDANTRSLLFANGYTFNLEEGVPPDLQGATGDKTFYATRMPSALREGRKVLALAKQNGNWESTPLDLTDVAFAPFCQEVGSESVEELVLIFVNAEHRSDKPFYARPVGLAPRLFTTNIGCGAWTGTAGIRETAFIGSDYESTVVDIESLKLSRQGMTLEQIAAGNGQVPFATVILPPNAIPGLAFLGGFYELTDLRASWTYEEEYSLGTTVCFGSGSGVLTEADVFASIFDVAPYLRGTLPGDIPSLYRSFFIQLVLLAPGEPVSGQCVGDGTSDPYTKAFGAGIAGGYRNTPEFGNLTIGASGDQINESWSLDELDTDLNVSSTRIP